jgi:phospholipid/cholesterol/gamma-HCH transport system substrate-binding protein
MGRLPERDTRQGATKRGGIAWRPSNALIAVIFLLIATVGPYLAFTKHIPFTSRGYELSATFSNAVSIAKNSPVRIAGVEVGKVIETSREGNATTVRFTVSELGRPVHDDAYAQIRPRIFLEGNFFVDLYPGSPSAPEMDSGETIPVSRTSTSVQFDELLNALQSPVRADLSTLLESYGKALTAKPTPEEDATQLPEVHGKSGAEGLNGAFLYGGDAGRYSAQVTNALLGTRPDDLSRLIAGAGRAFGALGRDEEALEGLIVNFDLFTGALAAQSSNLNATVDRFAPMLRTAKTSLVNLNRSLPPLRAYAIELRPAIAELPGLIESAEPWIQQAKPLFSRRELGGTAKLLREATPGLAGAAQGGKAIALPQANRISLCTTQVFVPTGNQTIEDQFATGPAYREFFYMLANFAGWGQNFDGNGYYLRVQPGGGEVLVTEPNPLGNLTTDEANWANTIAPPIGTQPQLTAPPPKKPDVRCDRNPVPNLNGALGQPGPPSPAAVSP